MSSILKFYESNEIYRVTHMQVTLLQRLVYGVCEVFGVKLIIFIKYGLRTIDIYNNNSFYFHNKLKMPASFMLYFCIFESLCKESQKCRIIHKS